MGKEARGSDKAENFRDSVGIGAYRIDLHPSTGNRNYLDIDCLPFQIPLGSLIPVRNPSKIIGMYREPLIAPETAYEVEEGFRTNVIFPGGLILEEDGSLKIYYGASDTVECLATARVEDLIRLCRPAE